MVTASAQVRERKAMSQAEITVALRKRFPAPQYAFLPQVRNATGWSRTTRTADALAMGLWPSRGLELHGFEIKSSRSDWLTELRNPEKADEIAMRCDRWWIVVGDQAIVAAGELPPTWGLLVPDRGQLVPQREAPKLESKPLDRTFLAAILRKASTAVTDRAEVQAEVDVKVQETLAEERKRVPFEVDRLQREVDGLRKEIVAFSEASGVPWNSWASGRVGAAVRFVLDQGGADGVERMLARSREQAAAVLAAIDRALEQSRQGAAGGGA